MNMVKLYFKQNHLDPNGKMAENGKLRGSAMFQT